MTKRPYYIGLDCGTNSIGWAVTDENYRLLKGTQRIRQGNKTHSKKQTLWGFELFEAADTAAERRTHRSSRRRNQRAKNRLKLLRMLFRDEIMKVDPEFFQRLRESFYYEEDKHLKRNSKNTLFNDPDFTDKDFHKLYPTVWHLRQAIVRAEPNEHFDLRLYFLAIQHILKHRGHFLLDGEIGDGGIRFDDIFVEFQNEAMRVGYNIADVASEAESIILRKTSKTDRKKDLKSVLFIEGDELDEETPHGQTELAGLIVGSKVDLKKIFTHDGEAYKFSFAEGVFEDKLPEIEDAIGTDSLDLIFVAKKIYNYAILKNLLDSHQYISDAMVSNYNQHQVDLQHLKQVFKPYSKIYHQLFKTEVFDEKAPSYNAYIGKTYTEDKNGRRSSKSVSQEEFNKYLHKLLLEIEPQIKPDLEPILRDLIKRSETGEKSTQLLLPKQRGQAKGTIPQQLHNNELKLILKHLQHNFPSFAVEVLGEDNRYNTKAKKILKIHEFRIPYYCGPLVKRKFDDDGNPVVGGKSQFSWADEEISELVYPWNFDQLVDKDSRAESFIRRMTNECTYLIGEDVLPKCSLIYQKYMVLNELNNLKINGQRIDSSLKQGIFKHVYKNGELKGNITLNKLGKWCRDNGFIGEHDKLSGTSEVKTLPKYQTYQDFSRILGANFEKQYSPGQLEEIIEIITILGDEKTMLMHKIAQRLNLPKGDRRIQLLAKLSYKDWGRLSAKFLDGIILNNRTILDYLWEDNKNLMELLGQEVGFSKIVDEYNQVKRPISSRNVTYHDVNALYCSPAVKRSVWRTIRIVNELIRDLKYAPKKIFIEVTRGEDEEVKGKYTLARKGDLEAKIKAMHTDDVHAILQELGGYEDRDLQSKKLFLYFSQMGKCAYSGESIDLEELVNGSRLYDIDHIYPRSKTKDDSITRNLVLVKANLNREKTNIYPISDSIRSKMAGIWHAWWRANLITKDKYERLVRSMPLTSDELGGFIARQLVETSQSVKAIRDLLERAYPESKIIMVKASQVSEYRHMMSRSGKSTSKNEGVIKSPGMSEFIKVRDLNDLHHAKDAYLNIVVGNVMNSTFTDNPIQWVKERDFRQYSIRPELLFRESKLWKKAVMDENNEFVDHYEECSWPEVNAWNFTESIKIVSNTMRRNDVSWTRMTYVDSKEISDLQLIGKSERGDSLLRIKNQKRLDPKKYGGYNSLKGAHFALIECQDKKGNSERRVIQIPIIAKNCVEEYVAKDYNHAKIILPVIKIKSLLKIDGEPVVLANKDTDSRNGYYHAKQAIFAPEVCRYAQRIYKIAEKDRKSRQQYIIDEEKDQVSLEQNQWLYDVFCEKLKLYANYPLLSTSIPKIIDQRVVFTTLDLKQQCLVLKQMFYLFSCAAQNAKLNAIGCGDNVGRVLITNSTLFKHNHLQLVNQSPTGLYQEIIDLKTAQPKFKKRES